MRQVNSLISFSILFLKLIVQKNKQASKQVLRVIEVAVILWWKAMNGLQKAYINICKMAVMWYRRIQDIDQKRMKVG